MTDTAIHVEGLGKRYRVGSRERYSALRDVLTRAVKDPFRRRHKPDYLWALRDVFLDISAGEVVGLIGRNGAGKTTLLKLLSRITRPTEGFAEVYGRIGSLLEVGTGFHPELSGRENIFLSGAILGMSRHEIAAKHDEIVAFAEVERFLGTQLKHFSTGMQMRLAFAVAAHLEPEILLVDEVLAVGDLEFQKKCLGKMQEVSRSGRTIVFVSHQMNQIRRLCERVIWIDGGRVRAEGPTGIVAAEYESSTLRGGGTKLDANHCFLRWSVSGKDNVLRDGLGEIAFHFHVVLREVVSQGHFGMTIFNDAGSVIGGWGFDNLELDEGSHEIILRLPLLPLQPGAYMVACSIWNHGNNLTGGREIEQWYGQPPLVVDSRPLAHPQDRWAGLMNIPGELLVCSVNLESNAAAQD